MALNRSATDGTGGITEGQAVRGQLISAYPTGFPTAVLAGNTGWWFHFYFLSYLESKWFVSWLATVVPLIFALACAYHNHSRKTTAVDMIWYTYMITYDPIHTCQSAVTIIYYHHFSFRPC